jgi:hypothetical protein
MYNDGPTHDVGKLNANGIFDPNPAESFQMVRRFSVILAGDKVLVGQMQVHLPRTPNRITAGNLTVLLTVFPIWDKQQFCKSTKKKRSNP